MKIKPSLMKFETKLLQKFSRLYCVYEISNPVVFGALILLASKFIISIISCFYSEIPVNKFKSRLFVLNYLLSSVGNVQ